MNYQITSGIIAFILWGGLPIFWKLLHQAPLVVLCHRILWALVFLRLWLWISRDAAVRPNKIAFFRSIAIIFNWGIYIWAVQNGHVLASSIGYFIAPIFYMIAGLIIDKEKFTKGIILILILFCISVINLSYRHLEDILISLGLAISIIIYGLIQRYYPCKNNIIALEQEALCLAPLALVWLAYQDKLVSTFSYSMDNVLLALSGPATVIPLLFYGYAIQRVNLSLFSMLTFISPTLQFFLALTLFAEPLDSSRLISLVLVWLGVTIYLGLLYKKSRNSKIIPQRYFQKEIQEQNQPHYPNKLF